MLEQRGNSGPQSNYSSKSDLHNNTDSDSSDDENELQKDCPVCFQFMVNPCRLDCGHVFCTKCIKIMKKPSDNGYG